MVWSQVWENCIVITLHRGLVHIAPLYIKAKANIFIHIMNFNSR